MSLRLTEEEAKALGFVKTHDGSWWKGNINITADAKSTSRIDVRGLDPKIQVRSPDGSSIPQQNVQWEAKAEDEVERDYEIDRTLGYCGRYRIVVTVFKRRHSDPDNLVPKWFIDELMRHGVIPEDSSRYVDAVEKRIVKIDEGEERTEIEVYVR